MPGPSERIRAQPVWMSATALGARARGTRAKTTVWRRGMSIACATPPRNAKAKSAPIPARPARSASPRVRVRTSSQPLTMSISARRGKRSIATPAAGAKPSVATERTRLRPPSAAPEPVRS